MAICRFLRTTTIFIYSNRLLFSSNKISSPVAKTRSVKNQLVKPDTRFFRLGESVCVGVFSMRLKTSKFFFKVNTSPIQDVIFYSHLRNNISEKLVFCLFLIILWLRWKLCSLILVSSSLPVTFSKLVFKKLYLKIWNENFTIFKGCVENEKVYSNFE